MKKKIAPRTRGRPVTTGKGELIGVRILPDLMASLDGWITKKDGELSRPEAIRRIVTEFLKRRGML